jgi:hypothetical protein
MVANPDLTQNKRVGWKSGFQIQIRYLPEFQI